MPVETELHAIAGLPGRPVRPGGTEAVAIPVRPVPDGPVVAQPTPFDDLLPADVPALLAHHEAKGEPGEVVILPVPVDGAGNGQRADAGGGFVDVLFYGVGDLAPAGLRRAGAALTRRCKGTETLVAVPPEEAGDDGLAAFAEGALLAAYTFRIGSAEGRKAPPRRVELVMGGAGSAGSSAAAEPLLARVRAVAGAVALARDLTNTPSAEKSPAWLAERAAGLAGHGGLTVAARTAEELRAQGFGGLVAVGSGATRGPRLIELAYEPPAPPAGGEQGAPSEHVVLVGKGITFDSGGLSLKPNANMKLMKTDMAGGAAVIAVMGALAALGVRHKVTGLVAAAENMPSGSAMRPGDVIRHFGGRTSEVLNTDAEGRLVLADALAYADARLAPDTVVDIATLTGAAKVALGTRYAAMFATDDALAGDLHAAGEASGERVWRMPLVDDYRSGLDSDIADVANIERGGRGGGSIAAALFLREFAGGRRWAHLDIAGPARATSDEAEITKGATGYGVRLLLRWLTGA